MRLTPPRQVDSELILTENALSQGGGVVVKTHNVYLGQSSRRKACGKQVFYVLCEANEIFVVGIDVGDLDVN